jgi:excisionase family DNA binding protein
MGSALQGMTGAGAMAPAGGQPSGGAPAGAAASAIMPDVMTPAEAATFLKVTEADVVAAITSGDLKAKKIGTSFRISKSALEDFLKS